MTDTTAGLTAHDTRALRNATSLCFDHLADGTGRIRAIREASSSDTGYEQTHVIPVELSRVHTYGPDTGTVVAFHMFHSPRYDELVQTLIRHMRTGARVALVWTQDNSSPITKDAGLVRDELRVRIQAKGVSRADTYLVAVQVGLDNSARMVRPIGSYAHGTSGIRA